MPRYDYKCRDCGEAFEVRMSIAEYSQGASPNCTGCGSEATARSFGPVNVIFGSGGGGGSAAACGPSGFS